MEMTDITVLVRNCITFGVTLDKKWVWDMTKEVNCKRWAIIHIFAYTHTYPNSNMLWIGISQVEIN